MIPKTTLTGTTMATISTDRLKAEIAAGVVTDATNAPIPSPNARQRITATGRTTSTPRYASAMLRAVSRAPVPSLRRLLLAAQLRSGEEPKQEQYDERDEQQRHRHRGGVQRPVDLDLLLDVLEDTWVTPGMFPPMRTTDPYSPMARAKASPPPLRIAGARVGSRTRRRSSSCSPLRTPPPPRPRDPPR